MSNRPGRKMGRQQQMAARRDVKAAKADSSRLTWWIGGGVAVAVAVALAVALAVGGGDKNTNVKQVAFAEVSGSGLPLFEGNSGPADTAVGQPAPTFRGSNFDDERIEVTPGDGRGKVVGFFAHWCPHCQAELPRLTDWLDDNEVPDNVDVYAVSTGYDEGRAVVKPSVWFDDVGWPLPVVRDSDRNDIANAYGLSGYPFFVVLDGQGNVLGRASGELDMTQWATLLQLAASGTGDTSNLGSDEVTELDESAAAATDEPGVQLVSPEDAAAVIEAAPAGLVVLDIRTPEEYDEVHLADATLVDFYEDDFADRIGELDRDLPYVLYCNSGNRSADAAQLMRDLEFSEVYEVDGGIQGWLGAGLPVV
ncbi:MAG: redoxin domain-containing protein [Acidimicrobiales bacterium]|nr:redoxin domain-containing protein [Acidimicrobiales bacterium]